MRPTKRLRPITFPPMQLHLKPTYSFHVRLRQKRRIWVQNLQATCHLILTTAVKVVLQRCRGVTTPTRHQSCNCQETQSLKLVSVNSIWAGRYGIRTGHTPALGPTQPPVKWVPGHSCGQNSRQLALTTHRTYGYTSTPSLCLHGRLYGELRL